MNILAVLTSCSLPVHLDGRTGTNRGTGPRQINFAHDWDAVQAWLSVYKEKRSTYLAYEKEVIRFYVWVILTLRKPLSSLAHGDWDAYREFLADPQPRDMWVGTAKRPRTGKDGVISPDYRPFAGPLQTQSIRFAERAIWRMFEWLASAGYLVTNPLKLEDRTHVPVNGCKRIPPDALGAAVLSWLARQPQRTIKERRSYARDRWIITLFSGTDLRSSEAISATMGDVVTSVEGGGTPRMSFIKVIGKGAKFREVPMGDDILQAMREYRAAFGLCAEPSVGESTPLIFSIQVRKGLSPITRQSLHTAFKKLFDAVAAEMEQEGNEAHGRVRNASTHWLREMSFGVKKVPAHNPPR